MAIHKTAIIAKTAKIGQGVEIGPYAIVGPNVKIGKNTKLGSHVVVDGYTTIGERCTFFNGACIGMPAQDKHTKASKPSLVIGDDNIIREYATIHCSTKEGVPTSIGDRNYLMVGAHVAHDCVLGSDIVVANNVGLAGHVTIEDQATLGGMVGVHQHIRIGRLAMVGGLSKVNVDVPPFSLCDGDPFRFYGANVVGLKRAGFSSKEMMKIRKTLKAFCASSLGFEKALERIKKEGDSDGKNTLEIIAFLEKSKTAIIRNPSKVE